ncbi:MAG: CocE/NonD family hydrolase [Gemmatimonadetes bacterium]|nr:CocE/NonD family hydrolase [Gemmatimonadota bacterium]
MRLALALFALLGWPAGLLGQATQQAPVKDYTPLYIKREVMIPMRDGARLFTAIYAPKDSSTRHPILMTRTPYSSSPYGQDLFPGFFRNPTIPGVRTYLRNGYIFVFQDVRGRYLSEGQFVDVRPYLADKRGKQDIDEASDTYDTAEWLIRNVPGNNGRIGVRGTSYPGFYSAMAAISGHPAIKAVSPQAPVTEWMGGDDFLHGGALLLPHAFDFFYARGFGRARPQPTTAFVASVEHGTPDGYQFFLERLGALSNANPRFLHDSIAFWNQLAQHPTWDAFWQVRSARPWLKDLKPALLWVGGWFDTENLWGALNAYAAAERQSPGTSNRLVMGPWSHGQWNGVRGDSLGALDWGSLTAVFYNDSIEAPFFNYHLLDGQPAPRPYEAAVFETGPNRWHFLDAWPPRGTVPTPVYLRAGGALALEPPAEPAGTFDRYVSDPAKPIPYTAEYRHWYDPGFMVEDQRFAARRPDVLVYRTEPLAEGLTVAGPVDVDFVVATSGTDADFIVKVIDVFPDSGTGGSPAARAKLGDYQMLVRGDVLRGKFRNSMSNPEPFTPDQPTPLRFRLNDVFHTFQAGHRLMVQVQSTWFPMIDRNPGKFMDIWQAKDADFQPTTQRVYRSASQPSRLLLPVLR